MWSEVHSKLYIHFISYVAIDLLKKELWQYDQYWVRNAWNTSISSGCSLKWSSLHKIRLDETFRSCIVIGPAPIPSGYDWIDVDVRIVAIWKVLVELQSILWGYYRNNNPVEILHYKAHSVTSSRVSVQWIPLFLFHVHSDSHPFACLYDA